MALLTYTKKMKEEDVVRLYIVCFCLIMNLDGDSDSNSDMDMDMDMLAWIGCELSGKKNNQQRTAPMYKVYILKPERDE